MAFQEGVDLTARAAVLDAAERCGINTADLDRALDDPQVKQLLRQTTEQAIAADAYGVPTFDAGGLLCWGDHQLPAAAAAAGGVRVAPCVRSTSGGPR